MTKATIDIYHDLGEQRVSRDWCASLMPGFEVVYDIELGPIKQILGGDKFDMFITTSGSSLYQQFWIIIETFLPSRDDGELVKVVHRNELRPEFAYNEDAILQLVRGFLVSVVIHEVDESIVYKGHRVFDPHRDEAPHVVDDA
jgi:hypothetical protein